MGEATPANGVPCTLTPEFLCCLLATILGLKAFGFLSIVALIAAALFILMLEVVFSVDAVTVAKSSYRNGLTLSKLLL